MWKHVLPLTLLFCASSVQSQSPPNPLEVAQLQQKALAHESKVRPVSMNANLVEPRQQLSQTMVSNVFIDRQLALRRDTEKLLALAAELKQNVDRTSPSVLSVEVIKKAQEIEKLAKSVKDKMKDAY